MCALDDHVPGKTKQINKNKLGMSATSLLSGAPFHKLGIFMESQLF
jgi:hypothetical protein